MKTFKGNSQSGAVLIVGLVMLLLLTIIGLAGMQDSGLQESMAGSMRDRNQAFQVAEAGLRAGEDELRKATITAPVASPVTRPGDPCYWWSCGGAASIFNWGNSNVITPTLGFDLADPQVLIELLPLLPAITNESSATFGPLAESRIYRVTSRSGGGTGEAVVVLQSTYKR